MTRPYQNCAKANRVVMQHFNLIEFMREARLIDASEKPRITALPGGVSSDIWLIEAQRGSFCVKEALATLRTEEIWHAPVERNTAEWNWFSCVATFAPDLVPNLLSHDPQRKLFAMAYLPPQDYPLWKQQLLAGVVDVNFAKSFGKALFHVHSATAKSPEIAKRFDNWGQFSALRLAPYFWHLGGVYPVLEDKLRDLIASLEAHRFVLTHGDVSPKNILCGPKGPVFLDAEVACYGDPAFDLAFCLNHLLLKTIIRPESAPLLLASFQVMSDAYLQAVNWENPDAIAARTASLLPALLLARVDGKSPVEYISDERDCERLRQFTLPLIGATKIDSPNAVADLWSRDMV